MDGAVFPPALDAPVISRASARATIPEAEGLLRILSGLLFAAICWLRTAATPRHSEVNTACPWQGLNRLIGSLLPSRPAGQCSSLPFFFGLMRMPGCQLIGSFTRFRL